MPIILGLVLCIAIWVGSLAWTMTNSRSRYQQIIKSRQANFIARSGFQHFFLKLKTMQRLCPESVRALEEANADEKKVLHDVFIEDIIVPPDDKFSGDKFSYRIERFDIESIDYDRSVLTIGVTSSGSYGGEKNLLKRLVRISR
ncbi:MAG: hypothetical protein PWR01_3288 [Clostridiales bacterium]|nr:hypothetical protein [Clostridiales bacterium]MDN5282215.1 hypothetical protein [Candidatus Ozemobacter sp.]